MRYDTLAPDEAAFKNRNDYTFTPFSVEVEDENLALKGMLCKPKNRSGYYNTPEPPPAKQRIVLHFTAGNLSGGMEALTRDNTRISVPFVIARDGTIYQLFPSRYWSGNLGKGVGNIGTNNAQDKATIGIEIINYGYLVKRGDNLETIYSDPANGKTDPYCKLSQTDAYQKLPQAFRNQDFYASYTSKQYDSLIILLRFLTKKYNIPRVFLDEAKRYETSNDVLNFKGIVSHVNYRGKNQFGGFEKWDVGPAFDWKTVINGVQANQYVPAFAQRDLLVNEDTVTSDDQIEAFLSAPRGLEVTPPDEDLDINFNENSANTGEQQPKKKLYALLVGIDKYENFPLHGCVNDMNAMKKYLSQKTDFDHQILTIQDKNASKSAVVKAFSEHLGKATANDTVFFYFSGHGTQEDADPIWKNETDEGLECFVCYNGNTTKSADFLFADKELRYLLHEVSEKTGAHIAVMFDCCHSGDNTRNLAAEVFRGKDTFVRRVYERASDFFSKRDWKDFIFSDKIDYKSVKNKNLSDFLPEGTYIQMSACESDEVALEVSGRGVFTSNFLQVLEKAGGDISYESLRSRVRQYMKFGFDQKPKISAVGNSGLLNTIFLNQLADIRKSAGEMIFNQTKNSWLLNLGAMHGAKEGMQVQIINPENAASTITAVIGEVFIDHAIIDSKDKSLKKDAVYKVLTDNLMVEKVQLFLNNVDGNQSELNALVKKLLTDSGGYYVFVEDELEADFTLHIQAGQCFVTRPKDQFRPLFLPVQLDDINKESLITSALKTISKWKFIQNLENKGQNSVNSDLLKIEVSQIKTNGSDTKLKISDHTVSPYYEKTEKGWKGALKIKVTNQSDRKLYFSAYYLPNNFSVSLDLMNDHATLLEPGKSVFLAYKQKEEIPYYLERIVLEYNWPKSVETIKFLVSSKEFDPEGFVQAGLPLPPLSNDIDKKREWSRKAFGEEESEESVNLDIWQTQKLSLEYANPEYNKVSKSWLDKILNYKPLAEFAFGLYYDVVPDEFGEPTALLKPELIVPPGEKGFLDDAKLLVANEIESWRRDRQYQQVKDKRTRIVAEGDSWFLYPFFVQEILDHLAILYAVKSLAAGGDTLEDIMKQDDYLATIKTEKPKFFLVSGGGNDILGKQFKDHLNNGANIPAGSPAQDYLKDTIWKKIDQIHGWYVQMFNKIRLEFPELPVIIHGYDYPIPVDTTQTPNKTSWLGKYMIEKGIGGQDVREKIIKFLIDRFNEKMKTLADDNRKIYFIDLRNTVMNKSEWYDEIHPTSDGFRQIAIKFQSELKELV